MPYAGGQCLDSLRQPRCVQAVGPETAGLDASANGADNTMNARRSMATNGRAGGCEATRAPAFKSHDSVVFAVGRSSFVKGGRGRRPEERQSMRATTLAGQQSNANGETQEMSMDPEDTSASLRALLE